MTACGEAIANDYGPTRSSEGSTTCDSSRRRMTDRSTGATITAIDTATSAAPHHCPAT